MSQQFRKLSHTLYECKYHIVFCPKYRFRFFDNEIGEYTKQQLYFLSRQKEMVEVLDLTVQHDHIHLAASIPPKYSVSSMMGFLKGKLSMRLFQRYERIGKKFWGRVICGREVTV